MIGYILIHGKNSGPKHPSCSLSPLREKLEVHSLTDERNYFWGYEENYSKNFTCCLEDIDIAVKSMLDRGSKKIFLIGHSLGAGAVIYYTSKNPQYVDGIVLLAPAHNIHLSPIKESLVPSINKAKKLIRQGHGDTIDDFMDFDVKDLLTVKTTPKNYLSFFDPEGPCNLSTNCKSFTKETNVLCLSGLRDPTQNSVKDLIYDAILKTNKSKFELTKDNHFTLPRNSHDLIVEWVKNLDDNTE